MTLLRPAPMLVVLAVTMVALAVALPATPAALAGEPTTYVAMGDAPTAGPETSHPVPAPLGC